MKRFSTLMWAMTAVALVLMVAPAALAASCCPDEGEGQLAALDYGRSDVRWKMVTENAGVHLTVSSPCGVFDRTYKEGEDPSFDIGELGPDNPNGTYTWQIRIEPVVDPDVKKALMAARLKGDDKIVKELRREGLLPAGPFIQSGQFTVVDGAIVGPGLEEDRGVQGKAAASRVPGDSLGVLDTETVSHITAATTISGDLTVYNSLCVGFDCATSESYGADTIRLKENNLRIHADDTSTISGFPNTDWRLEFNSQNSGGGGYFRVVDASAGRNVMTIEASAPSNSLVVDNGGRVGLGTANPVVELHISNGDTPTLRLEQNTSSGFAAQTWDVAGNETSFFIRDATNGSTLPFRIRPGAASNSLVIDNDDDVGIGTLSPTRRLQVIDTSAPDNTVLEVQNNGPTRIRINNSSNGEVWNFGHQSPSGTGIVISDVGDAVSELLLDTAGNLVIAGDLTANGTNYPSSRTLKENFAPIDNHDVLRRLSHVPVSLWSYKSDTEGRRHVGPVTEDFAAAFDFLKADGKLNTIDLHGIALAAIQGLNQEVAEKEARIEQLEARMNALEAQLKAAPASE